MAPSKDHEATTDASRSTDILQLHYSAEGHVTVTPRDEDRFSLKIARAIRGCQFAVQEEEFKKQIGILLNMLGAWLQSRSDVGDAYVTTREGGGFLFVALQKSPTYDGALEDALSELDLRIHNDSDLNSVQLDVMSLPPVSSQEALRTFLHPSMTLEFKRGHPR